MRGSDLELAGFRWTKFRLPGQAAELKSHTCCSAGSVLSRRRHRPQPDAVIWPSPEQLRPESLRVPYCGPRFRSLTRGLWVRLANPPADAQHSSSAQSNRHP
eukprot:scaffold619_cov403-Prasinococcus_capsulatus_cf.AAC.6